MSSVQVRPEPGIGRRLVYAACVVVALVVGMADPAAGAPAQAAKSAEPAWGERSDGKFYRLIDEAGQVITETAVILGAGDRYVDQENRLYHVVGIGALDGDHLPVRVKYERTITLPEVRSSALSAWASKVFGQGRGTVAIYHTHSDESYVPDSGTPSEEWGDIYAVGKALTEELERQGYEVVWSQNNHNPHDGQAYTRSRRTVAQLLRHRPVTMLDIHRDAIPNPNEYRTAVQGEPLSQVRLVIGRQNQNQNANFEYAQRIKAVADQRYPGLLKGIFLAQGDYNQDVGPRMILLEFGTHTTTLEESIRAARRIAEVLPAAAGLAPGTRGAANRGQGMAAGRALLWLVLIGAALAVGWILLNREGWTRFMRSVRRLGAGGTSEDGSGGSGPHEDGGPKE